MTEVTLSFGATPLESIGVVQSIGISESAEVAEARGPDGKVIAQAAYSTSKEYQIEVLFAAGTEPPAIGTIATIGGEGGWSGIVTARGKNETNNDYVKMTLTVQKKDAATQTPYA